jgi:hypothetical protein
VLPKEQKKGRTEVLAEKKKNIIAVKFGCIGITIVLFVPGTSTTTPLFTLFA